MGVRPPLRRSLAHSLITLVLSGMLASYSFLGSSPPSNRPASSGGQPRITPSASPQGPQRRHFPPTGDRFPTLPIFSWWCWKTPATAISGELPRFGPKGRGDEEHAGGITGKEEDTTQERSKKRPSLQEVSSWLTITPTPRSVPGRRAGMPVSIYSVALCKSRDSSTRGNPACMVIRTP